MRAGSWGWAWKSSSPAPRCQPVPETSPCRGHKSPLSRDVGSKVWGRRLSARHAAGRDAWLQCRAGRLAAPGPAQPAHRFCRAHALSEMKIVISCIKRCQRKIQISYLKKKKIGRVSKPGPAIHVATGWGSGWGSGWGLCHWASHSLGLPAPGAPVLPGSLRAFCDSCVKEHENAGFMLVKSMHSGVLRAWLHTLVLPPAGWVTSDKGQTPSQC